jgi:CarboxypepD_reg-like domain
MKYLLLFFTFFVSAQSICQTEPTSVKITGIVSDDNTGFPLVGANIINLNKVKGAITDSKGYFELEVSVSDTLHVSHLSYQSLKVKVTNDWIKNKTIRIQLTQKAIALEEVIIRSYSLTGYLEVDSKLIPIRENNRYSISGLDQGYETGEYAPNAFGKVLGSIFNPADMLYSVFGKKSKELKKLKQMKKDDTVRNLLESKYDRETISVLLGIEKNEIPEILQRCNYSESFIKTANDLQILDAISGCYEEYKVLKKK